MISRSSTRSVFFNVLSSCRDITVRLSVKSSVADINDPSKESSDEVDRVEHRGDGMEDLGDDVFDAGNDEAVET